MMRFLPFLLVIWCASFAVVRAEAPAPQADAKTTAEARRFAGMYFAPMDGDMFWRLYDPQGTGRIIEFKRRAKDLVFNAPNGWVAEKNGARMTVTADAPDAKTPRTVYRFENGLPRQLTYNGKTFGVALDESDRSAAIRGPLPQLWNEDRSKETAEAVYDIWRKGRWRFRAGFLNPNCGAVLMASLALLCLWPALFLRRRGLRLAGAAGTLVFGVLLFLTYSRGGMLGFAVGATMQVFCLLFAKGGRWRKASVLSVLVLVVVVALLAALSSWGGLRRGHDRRDDVWQAVPRMMADAPGGWGETTPGRAFIDWYQPLNERYVTWTLISDHLTRMTALGWTGRGLWVFGWLGALTLLIAFALRTGGNALPASQWAALAVPAVFNPVLLKWTLWVVPVASCVLFFRARPWRAWKFYAALLAIPAVLAGLVVVVLAGVGGGMPRTAGDPSVRVDGNRVLVNGENPTRWFVDDEETCGWVRAAKEVRVFYRAVPSAPALGFVRSLDDLPPKMHRLTLAGRFGRLYLEAWKKGTAPRATELVFLSPQFAPGEVPADLQKASQVMMIVGEFAARYKEVYGEGPFPEWVGVSPGAEQYIPGWVGVCAGR